LAPPPQHPKANTLACERSIDEYRLAADSRHAATVMRKIDDVGLLNRPGA
jgi:hypothetical protein